jgi:hypothetical protein
MKEDKKVEWWEPLALLAMAPFLMAIAIPVNGFVISKLWLWFVSSTFGLEPLSILQAFGLGLTLHFIAPRMKSGKFEGLAEEVGNFINNLLTYNIIILIEGYIVHRLM